MKKYSVNGELNYSQYGRDSPIHNLKRVSGNVHLRVNQECLTYMYMP